MSSEKTNYCVIMAGGVGTRFWPLSTHKKPKQFIDVLGIGKTFIQMTYDRFRAICPPENFFVVTGADYRDIVLEQLPELKPHQVLLEPYRRNTAPCIAYANERIAKENKEATIVVTPADHLILQEREFERVINNGIDFVKKHNKLLTIGLKPTRPETGYGYIQKGKEVVGEINKVKTFTEKPDVEIAKVFYESDEFLWNSGMFIWTLKDIQSAYKEHLPEMNRLFEKGVDKYMTAGEQEFINDMYSDCQNISIDYGIMEKVTNACVHTADFGWSDLGTWNSLYEQTKKDDKNNGVIGEHIRLYNSKNCMISIPSENIGIIQGLDNYIVVQKENRILICKRDDEQQIRQFVNDLMLESNKFI